MEILNHIPEVPVRETWEWLSDILLSHNGEEQRISLRGGVPRSILDVKLKATNSSDIFSLWGRLLKGRNEFWLPEYQLSAATSAETPSGSDRLYYDPAYTDIRAGEKVLVDNRFMEILNLETDGATLTDNVSPKVSKGSWVVPVGTAILDNSSSLNRMAVNEVGEFSLKGTFIRARDTLARPGTTSSLVLWDTVPVLDVRPLANNDLKDSIIDGQSVIDNKIGIMSIVNNWVEPKIQSTRKFLVSREPETACVGMKRDLDYWRHFFEYCRGSARKFWLPTYRNDLVPAEVPLSEATTILVEEFTYAQYLFFDQATHVYIEIATEQGTHRCEVTSVASEVGNTRCTFTPALPAGWVDIERISNIIPSRVNGDSVDWEHHASHSILSVGFRSAEHE